MELSPGRPAVAGGPDVRRSSFEAAARDGRPALHAPPAVPRLTKAGDVPAAPVMPIDQSTGVGIGRSTLWISGAAAIALLLKLIIAYSTFGTNDVMTYYGFARSLSDHGLEWTYRNGVSWLSSKSVFNHPPLTAYFLVGIYRLAQSGWLRSNGITFAFLLRLPGIIADFAVVILLLRMARLDSRLRQPKWVLLIFALSPVSIMVSGFHGNTDPVMVLFLVASCYMAARRKPVLCGLFFALSCQIKVVPLLFLPILICFWWQRRAVASFLVTTAAVFLALWSEPLLHFPGLFIKNVLSYGSYWGIWGITYWLRMTLLTGFSFVWFDGLSLPQNIVVGLLKAVILSSVCLIAWRRRALSATGLIQSIGYGWLIFFIFSPGVCAQYMVWLAPFILLLSPTLYVWLTLGSSLFLFFFYNVTAHGLPWYMAISTFQLNTVWAPWAVWPWAIMIAGLLVLWTKARAANPELGLFSLSTLTICEPIVGPIRPNEQATGPELTSL